MKDRRFHYVDAARVLRCSWLSMVIPSGEYAAPMRGAIFPMRWYIGSTSRCCFCSPVLGTPDA